MLLKLFFVHPYIRSVFSTYIEIVSQGFEVGTVCFFGSFDRSRVLELLPLIEHVRLLLQLTFPNRFFLFLRLGVASLV
jgi:hypothetical protein